jgi:hypothetical protein
MNFRVHTKKSLFSNFRFYSAFTWEDLKEKKQSTRLYRKSTGRLSKWEIPKYEAGVFIIMIRHDPFHLRLIVSSEVLQVVFVHLIHNSVLLLASRCSYLLLVIDNWICIFLVSRQLVLLSALPKFLHLFCGKKWCSRLFWKISSQIISVVLSFLYGSKFRVEQWGDTMIYINLLLKFSRPKLV